MLGLSTNLNYYLFNGNVDLRKGIFRLCEFIRTELQKDPGDTLCIPTDTRSPIPVIPVHSVGNLQYMWQS